MSEIHFDSNLNFDLGNLTVSDINSISPKQIFKTTQQNIKKLLQKLNQLPKQEATSASLIQLPIPQQSLPRALSPPAAKPQSRWDKYREQKGLGKRPKRSRMVYQPATDDWYARYGPYSIKKIQKKQTAVLQQEADGSNPFQKRAKTAQIQKLKQKKHQLKNKLMNSLEKKKSKDEVQTALKVAKSSTGSLKDLPKKRTRPREDKVGDEPGRNLEILKQLKKRKTK